MSETDGLMFADRADLARSLWTIDRVSAHYAVTRTAVFNWLRRDLIPQPFTMVGKSAVWLRGDIEATPRPERNRPKKVWTKARVVAAIREFERRYGRPPSASDWNVAQAKAAGHFEKVARFYEDGCYPHANCVYGPSGVFDFWADAIEAAGFSRPEPGRYATDKRRYRAAVDVDAVLNGRDA